MFTELTEKQMSIKLKKVCLRRLRLIGAPGYTDCVGGIEMGRSPAVQLSLRHRVRIKRAALLTAAFMVTGTVLLLGAQQSKAFYTCEGSTAPQTYLPTDGKTIKVDELIAEFIIWDDSTSESSNCMYVAISAAPYTRALEGWYANPVGTCNPVQRQVGGNFYSCTPSGTEWYKKPGTYKWITYKISGNCSVAMACVNLTDERSFTVTSDSSGGGGSGDSSCTSEDLAKLKSTKKKLKKLRSKRGKAAAKQRSKLNRLKKKLTKKCGT